MERAKEQLIERHKRTSEQAKKLTEIGYRHTTAAFERANNESRNLTKQKVEDSSAESKTIKPGTELRKIQKWEEFEDELEEL